MGAFAFWTWAKGEKCKSEKGMQPELIFVPYARVRIADAPCGCALRGECFEQHWSRRSRSPEGGVAPGKYAPPEIILGR
jgi:hypothetical protein